jgi:outer membrane protein assembly factor BamB
VRALAVLAAGAAVASCSGGGDENPFSTAVHDEDASSTTPPTVPPMEVLWTNPGQFVTRPVLVGSVVVSFVAQDGGLVLVANDPATGAEVWRRSSSVSEAAPGVVFDLVTDGQRIFHMTPTDAVNAVVEAIDVATGQPTWQTPPRTFVDLLAFCDDVSGPLCTVKIKSTGDTALWRLAPDTGVLNEMDDINGHDIDGRLYDLFDSPDIARVVGGAVVWQRPETDLFGGAPVSPEAGWDFREVGDLVVGQLRTVADWPADGEVQVPTSYVAGIASATGETRWTSEGDPVCGARFDQLDLRVEGQRPWIRCHITGTVTMAGGHAASRSYTDVVMEGFDPATGATTWKADLGAASALDDPSKVLARQSPTTFVVARDDGSLLAVDVGTGATTTPASSLAAWCSSPNEYPYPAYAAVYPDHEARSGKDYLTPCDLTGTTRPAPSKPDEGIGAIAGDIFVWMDANGLHGARIPA